MLWAKLSLLGLNNFPRLLDPIPQRSIIYSLEKGNKEKYETETNN